MDARDRYVAALGSFRMATHAFAVAGAGLQNAAHALDPQRTAEDDPAAVAVFDECVAELRGMAVVNQGFQQLFQAALTFTADAPEDAPPHSGCAGENH